MAKANNFSPNYGILPHSFIQRDDIIAKLGVAVANKYSPFRSTIIDGLRGVGKTTLALEFERLVKKNDKSAIIIHVTNQINMSDDIIDGLRLHIKPKNKLKGANANVLGTGLGVTTDQEIYQPQSFSGKVQQIMEQIGSKRFVLFVIDEVQGNLDGLRQFGTVFQELKNTYNVMVIFTGLSNYVDSMLTDKLLTFLQRSERLTLTALDESAIAQKYLSIFGQNGKTIAPQIALRLANLSAGYAFAFQAIGYQIWETGDAVIDEQTIQKALPFIQLQMNKKVFELIDRDLPKKRHEFLLQMAQSQIRASAAEMNERVDGNVNSINQLRIELIKMDLIKKVSAGYVWYTLPFMREFYFEKLHADPIENW
ncbi:MAG: ATP-binding protein [Lactobacillaceae bacterium]|jgi:AAA+ ATPase superfamily predicted ATPase|nr:ATP-binding protein [Lactobacillaceae bacterium]